MTDSKLFLFPYAGGAAASYNGFRQFLDPSVEFRAIELAARGRRMREPNYNNLDDAVDDVFKIIKNELTQCPYALFGHSMGSMIAFELAYKIRDNNLPMPTHIIFSGRAAPYVSREGKRTLHHLADDEFKKELLEMGGTPKQLFDHPELMEVFLPLLKGDFRLTETYIHPEKSVPLDVDITVLSGKEDEDTPEEVEAFRAHTTKNCDIHYFEGEHFFIHEETKKVLDIINAAIKKG